MAPHTPAGVIWPVRLAYAAALIFTAASGTTNLLYGWNKGTDLGSSLVWATVSLGVSIVFALSWPAFIRATDQRQNIRAFIILVGLLLTGTYSVSAALGSAYGGRVQAAKVETDKEGARTKANAGYKSAKDELDTLPTARSRSELDPQIRTLKATKGANDCATRDGPISRKVCAEADALEAEAARADRRIKLAETMRNASKTLEAIGMGTVANSDAVALASYLNSVGVKADPEVINKLLVLLAVLVIECGGGVSLAIGMSLATPAERPDTAAHSISASPPVSGASGQAADTRTSGRTPQGWTPPDTATGHAAKPESHHAARCPDGADSRTGHQADTNSFSVSGVRLLRYIRERGGVLAGGQRTMAAALGWSKSRMNEVLHELASGGLVKLTTGHGGTVVQLVPI